MSIQYSYYNEQTGNIKWNYGMLEKWNTGLQEIKVY